MNNVALVIEGGALRGVYTAAVLDVFLERNLQFPYVIGTSSGCLTGLNYVTQQKGRAAHININYCDDKQYIGLRNLLFHGGVFNFGYLFEEPTDRWQSIDKDTYNSTNKVFYAVATSCKTGKAMYFQNPKGENFETCLRASSSMPLLSKIVKTEQGDCLDGGVSESIPYQKPLTDGFEKIVVIKTREHEYRKEPTTKAVRWFYRRAYGKYPEFIKTAINRPEIYNKQLLELYELEKQGKAFIIEPSSKVRVKRTEKDKEKLKEFYRQGENDVKEKWQELENFLHKK